MFMHESFLNIKDEFCINNKKVVDLRTYILFFTLIGAFALACNPPGSGTWTIDSSIVTCSNKTINNSAIVLTNSTLVLSNSTVIVPAINISNSTLYVNETIFYVGDLLVDDSEMTFNSSYLDIVYTMEIYDSNLTILDSDVYAYWILLDLYSDSRLLWVNSSMTSMMTYFRGLNQSMLEFYDANFTEFNVGFMLYDYSTAIVNDSTIFGVGTYDESSTHMIDSDIYLVALSPTSDAAMSYVDLKPGANITTDIFSSTTDYVVNLTNVSISRYGGGGEFNNSILIDNSILNGGYEGAGSYSNVTIRDSVISPLKLDGDQSNYTLVNTVFNFYLRINMTVNATLINVTYNDTDYLWIYNSPHIYFNESNMYQLKYVGDPDAKSDIHLFGTVEFEEDGVDFFRDNTNLTRHYPIYITNDMYEYNSSEINVLNGDGDVIFTGTTDDDGYIDVVIMFNESNYDEDFYLADEYLDTFKTLMITTDTPVAANIAGYDLADYPNMFITDGYFDGLLVVGRDANALNTIAVTNIALGLQQAAVTRTMVCSENSTMLYLVDDGYKIEASGVDFNVNDAIPDILAVPLDDGDLPTLLTDGQYDESEGNTDNDAVYTQELELLSGSLVYDEDDDDAPAADFYLYFEKSLDIYNYSIEFPYEDVQWDTSSGAEDFLATKLEMQGEYYTIIDAGFAANDKLLNLTLMSGNTVLWIAEGETLVKTIDAVEHEITLIDVVNASECEFEVDGSPVSVAELETETVEGLTIGVTRALDVNSQGDDDICRLYVGASIYVFHNGSDITIDGSDISGSEATIYSSVSAGTGHWTGLSITYEPDDDIYLAEGDEFIDPILGNFKYVYANHVAVYEDILLNTTGNEGRLSFSNYEGDNVIVPFITDSSGNISTGYDPNLTLNPDQGFYFEGDICNGSGDLLNCEGAQFLVVSAGDVARVLEISNIDEGNDEISFDDLTVGASYDNKDYTNSGADLITLAGGIGDITLAVYENGGYVGFTDIDNGDILTENEAIIDIIGPQGNRDNISFKENNEDLNMAGIFTSYYYNGTNLVIDVPYNFTGSLYPYVDFDDTIRDHMYHTDRGSVIRHNEIPTYLLIQHPEETLYAEIYVAPSDSAVSILVDGCNVSETVNPIPATVNKFDTEISDPFAQNLISVGDACYNSITDTLLGQPEVCHDGLEEGQAKIVLFGNDTYQLAIYGGTDIDTQKASMVLQNYEDYNLAGTTMYVNTVSASSLIVSPSEPDDDDEGDDDDSSSNNDDENDNDDSPSSTPSNDAPTITVSKPSTTATQQNIYVDVTTEKPIEMKITKEQIVVSQISIQLKNNISGVTRLQVSSLEEDSVTTKAAGRVYQYLEITPSRIEADDIGNVTIQFSVKLSWLEEHNTSDDKVVLMRFHDNKWEELETKKASSAGGSVRFRAYSSGFSTFAVALKEEVAEEAVQNTTVDINETVVNRTESITMNATNETEPIIYEDSPEKEPIKIPWNIIIILFIMIGLGSGSVLTYMYREQIKEMLPKKQPKGILTLIIETALIHGLDRAKIKEHLPADIDQYKVEEAFQKIEGLHNYITEQHARGHDYKVIKDALIKNGWDKTTIEKLYKLLKILS